MHRAAAAVLGAIVLVATAAPWITSNPPDLPFGDRAFAPPMRVHISDNDGWHAPFVYRQRLVNRIDRTYVEDHATPVPLRWLTNGRLVSIDPGAGPLLWCGADALGRDLCARLVYGARLSLGVAVLGACGALLIGALLGAVAGSSGGRLDTLITTVADFVLILPVVYLVIVLRAMRPLVISLAEVFWLMTILFALVAWPDVARGVRSIVATERTRDYAAAARALGAGRWRVMTHLLPAAYGFLRIEFVLLIPALLVAESTLSFVGFGFGGAAPSWGGLLKDGEALTAMYSAPWLLLPAAALFVVVLALQAVAGARPGFTGSVVDTPAARR